MKKSEAIGGFTAAVGFKAVLGEDGQWRCDRPDIERLLNAQFAPKRIGPSGGVFGATELNEAARMFGGQAVFFHDEPPDSGEQVVY